MHFDTNRLPGQGSPHEFTGTDTYVASNDLLVSVQAARALEMPLLVKGEPGTGKTVLAEEVAKALGLRLITWTINSRSTAEQGLFRYDGIAQMMDGQAGDERAKDRTNYIGKGRMWEAFESEEPTVVLIDEIDKADIEFPNDLLELLDRMKFTVERTGQVIEAKHRPIVIITSNNEKELPPAFLRRCQFVYIDFPDEELMTQIVRAHFPDIQQDLMDRALERFYELRELDLAKPPSTSELLNFITLLQVSDTAEIHSPPQPPFLGALLKNEQDQGIARDMRFRGRDSFGRGGR